MAYIYATKKLATSMICEIRGLDTAYSYNDRYAVWYFNGVYKGDLDISAYVSVSNDAVITGLADGTTYSIEVEIFNNGGLLARLTGTATTAEFWEWETPKIHGSDFRMYPDEWLAFYDKIDQARALNGMAAYAFTRTASYYGFGKPFLYWMFRQAAAALDPISALIPPEFLLVATDDQVLNEYFDTLKAAVNDALT